mgnify:CR=1 FL=1
MIPIKYIDKAPETDGELLLLFKKTGNQDVLAKLYLRYTDLVYGVCLKYFKDGEAAKDAVMNIYQELVQKLPLHEVENFKSWLYVLAKNHCLMQLRAAKKMVTVEFQPGFMQSEDFEHLDTVLEREQDFKKLEYCMERLPDNKSKVYNCFIWRINVTTKLWKKQELTGAKCAA